MLEFRGHQVTVFDRNPKRLSHFADSNIRVFKDRDELGDADVLVETTGDTDVLDTFASATVLNRRYGWKVGVPAFGVASYVAASRVADGKHFLSDVFFGVAIGLVGGRTVTFDRGETRVQVSPMPVAGGAGIQVSVFRMSACETAD